jgi:O-antigen ligase
MGWYAVTHEDFVPHTEYVQPHLDHLHNNLLQVALETGWLGLAVWLAWMGLTARVLYVAYRRLQPGPSPLSGVAAGGLAAFGGLMLNGLVEYNFGDTEILMLLSFIMGLSAMLYARRPPSAEAGTP